MEELKPCPFCGSNVDLMWWDHEHQNVKRWEPCDEEWGAVFPFVHCVMDATALLTLQSQQEAK